MTGIARAATAMPIGAAADRLEALGNTTRLGVYRALVAAGGVGLAVGQVQRKLNLPASTLSHHLRRLIEAGLVTQERQGTTLICRADGECLRTLVAFLSGVCTAGPLGAVT